MLRALFSSTSRTLCMRLLGAYCVLVTLYSTPEVSAEPAAASPVKIGVLLTLTGSYAPVGDDNRKGIELALAEASNSSDVTLVYADSRSDPTHSVNEFRHLVETEKVAAVFAFRGPVGMAVNPLSAQSGIPLLGGVGNKDFSLSNKFAFQFWPRSDVEGQFLAAQIAQASKDRVALFTAEDDWTAAVSDGLRHGLTSTASRLVFDESVNPNEIDFRTLLTKMRAKNPDTIVANVGLKQIGPLVRQIRDMHLPVPIYSNFWAPKAEVVASAGKEAIEGLQFVEMSGDLKNFSGQASGATVSSYTAILFLLQAIHDQRASRTSFGLYESLMAQTEVRTQSGVFPIKDRCVTFPLTLRTIHDGKVKS